MAFPTGLEIARSASLKPLDDIAAEMGLSADLLEPYGDNVKKIKLAAIAELADRPKAKYVVVTAITPTPLGEGETTTTIRLAADHQATEQLLRDSGVPYVLLRNSWYHENYTDRLPAFLAQGAIPGSAGEGRISAAARKLLKM